jgi:hypothetical protein
MRTKDDMKASARTSTSRRKPPIRFVSINKPDIELAASALLPLILDMHAKANRQDADVDDDAKPI